MDSGNKGLANLGNTCYMNTAIQCLSHLPEFHPLQPVFSNESTKIKGCVFNEWYSLQEQLWNNETRSPVVPRQFLSKFIQECRKKNVLFNNFQQNDTEEFINIFMDLLHQNCKKKISIKIEGEARSELSKLEVKAIQSWSRFFKEDYSYIIKKFYSQLLSITSCPKCDYNTVNFDPFMVLSLEIPQGSSTLYECLDSYTKKTTLDCDNSWVCDKCKQKVQPEKKLILWKSSDVLIIQLKRYSIRSKKDNFIHFPLNLTLDPYLIDYQCKGKQYRLSGICIQSGSLGGGHYYAMCHNEKDNKWREYNDTHVREIDESELLKQKPYCLFYRRV
jgi:ubiquitin carboxyl-terminal hydrolase 8